MSSTLLFPMRVFIWMSGWYQATPIGLKWCNYTGAQNTIHIFLFDSHGTSEWYKLCLWSHGNHENTCTSAQRWSCDMPLQEITLCASFRLSSCKITTRLTDLPGEKRAYAHICGSHRNNCVYPELWGLPFLLITTL